MSDPAVDRTLELDQKMARDLGQKKLTTAQALGRFRRELADEGFGPAQIDELVRDAFRTLIENGLAVKTNA